MAPPRTPPASPSSFTMGDDDEEEEGDELLEDDVEEVSLDDSGPDSEEDNDIMESIEDEVSSKIPASVVFENHLGSVFCCSIEPKLCDKVVTGGEDDKAYVWDINTGSVLLECKNHMDSVTSVEFNYDGTMVATGDMKGGIKVWKLTSKICVWKADIEELRWLKWHQAANVLLTGTYDGNVYVWKVPGTPYKILPGYSCPTECAVIMPDGKRCVVGYNNGKVKVFDIKSCSCLYQIETGSSNLVDEYKAVACMDAHSDNNLVIVGCLSGETYLITSQNGKVVGKLIPVTNIPNTRGDENTALQEDVGLLGSGSIEAVAFCKDSSLSLAATGSLSGMLCIWDISRQVSRHMIKLRAGITKLLWDRCSPHLYVACITGIIRLYDGRSGTVIHEFSGHTQDILDIAISVNGKKLVSASDDHTAKVFPLSPPDS